MKSKRSTADFGHPGIIFDEEDVIRLLRVEIEKEGSQAAFARRYSVDRPNVNAMLSGRIPVSKDIADAIGLRRTHTPK
jgi:plasmid maintenance system antidote protein VapI